MDAVSPVVQPSKSHNIFNLTDDALSNKLEFIDEIGFGNWGSVWRCFTKAASAEADGFDRLHRTRIAVKLVHRHPNDQEKSKTTAARVKSLWNEMKIVGSFKHDPHPAIISFYSFIVTPSYALITMACHQDVVPVEVDESQARIWFRFLLSGVEFLHKRGVAHNDIKPANILLSHKGIPVLIDFGFAERYDVNSPKAFHSNLSYGTPEYLSPERARGLPHDTRKSDVWSLGVTFFEILMGRTPFEGSDKDTFVTKEDLERYWSRTFRGKWLGSWKMSRGMEKLLRRMISPNADLRCTAYQAKNDEYWHDAKDTSMAHRRSSSATSSIVFEKDVSKLLDSPCRASTGKHTSPRNKLPYLDKSPRRGLPVPGELYGGRHTVTKVKSQPKVKSPTAINAHRVKRVPAPSVNELPTIIASPPTSPMTPKNRVPSVIEPKARRAPLAAVPTNKRHSNNVSPRTLSAKPSARRVGTLAELSGAGKKGKGNKENHVTQRVRDWERERERLREQERLIEIERERDEEIERDQDVESADDEESSVVLVESSRGPTPQTDESEKAQEVLIGNHSFILPNVHVSPIKLSPLSPNDTSTRNFSVFKHSVKRSIDKTMQFYKISNKNHVTQSTQNPTIDDNQSRRSCSERQSWEDDALVREAKSSLPVVRQALYNEKMGVDNQANRMAIWMKNVEKVVEDAKQTFQTTNSTSTTLPPLPLAPRGSRSNRSSRLPRKVLAANQIFADEHGRLGEQSMSSYVTSVFTDITTEDGTQSSTLASENPAASSSLNVPYTNNNVETSLSSKREKKIFELKIKSVAELERELSQSPSPPLLSPRSIQTPSRSPTASSGKNSSVVISKSFDELTSSPLHVEPYPARKVVNPPALIESPRKVESAYDRFLMATSGVKRAGKGYESDNFAPVHNTIHISNAASHGHESHRAFYSVRKPMPPPVSSDDQQPQRRTVSVDELGLMTVENGAGTPILKDESNTTVTFMRRAMKAFVPASRRQSRMH